VSQRGATSEYRREAILLRLLSWRDQRLRRTAGHRAV